MSWLCDYKAVFSKKHKATQEEVVNMLLNAQTLGQATLPIPEHGVSIQEFPGTVTSFRLIAFNAVAISGVRSHILGSILPRRLVQREKKAAQPLRTKVAHNTYAVDFTSRWGFECSSADTEAECFHSEPKERQTC